MLRFGVFVGLALALLLLVAVFGADWYSLIQQWLLMDGAYSHGFLLLLCCGWMLWQQRSAIDQEQTSPSVLGGAVFVLSLLVWMAGRLLLIDVVSQSLLPALMLSMVWAVFGWSVLKRCLLPLALLWFAIPFWDYLGFSLQQLTVAAIQFPLTVSQVQFVIQGTLVELPGIGVFEVAFGCSGLRYLLIACVLSVLMADMWFKQWRQQFLIVAAGIFLGLLSNWIRVASIIYIGNETNMQSSLVDDHETFGWIVFALLVAPGIWAAARWSERLADREVESKAAVEIKAGRDVDRSKYNASTWVLAGVLVIASAANFFSQQRDTITPQQAKIEQHMAGWQALPIPLGDGLGASIQRPDELIQGSYFRENSVGLERMTVTVYGYQYQRREAELFSFGNRFIDTKRWHIKHNYMLPDEKWHLLELAPTVRWGSNARHFVATSYLVGGRLYADSLSARLAQLPAQLRGDRYTAAITIHLSCSDCEGIGLLLSPIENIVMKAISHNL